MLTGFSGGAPSSPPPSGAVSDVPSGTNGDIGAETQARIETLISQDTAAITEATADHTVARFGA
jgi:hypothetical protein